MTANYFAVVKPSFALGRGFDPERDDRRGAPPVVVLGHDLWQRTFGGDPAIVGRSIWINGMATVVIGVVADGFRGTDVGIVSEFWIPFSMIDQVESRSGPVTANRTRFWLACVARLRPGVDTSAARAELDVIARTLNRLHARGDDRGFAVERAGQIDPRLRTMAVTLFTVALALTVLVLLTACGNVANLLLGRAAYRRREIAARMALGATRARLVRQLLTESLVLALLGALGGWLIAAYASSLLGFVRTPLGWPVDLSVAPDARVFLFCLVLSVATGVAFGLLPALRATRPELVTDLKADAGGLSRRESPVLRNGLVTAQVTVCTVLMLCTGLSLRSLQVARTMDVGLSVRNHVLLAFDPAVRGRSDAQSRQLLRGDSRESAGGGWCRVRDIDDRGAFDADHQQLGLRDRGGCAEIHRRRAFRGDIYAVGPGFFATMGIRFLEGDDFRAGQCNGARASSSTTHSPAPHFRANHRSAVESSATARRSTSSDSWRPRSRARSARHPVQ